MPFLSLLSRPSAARTLLLASATSVVAAALPAEMPARTVTHSQQHVAAPPRPQGYLGIEFHDLSEDEVSQLHLRSAQGAEVVMVDHDGPAGKAGLRPHDIITALNGQIVDSAAALRRMIHDAGANVQIALSVFRSGRSMTVNAKLADRSDVTRDAEKRLRSLDPGDTEYTNGFIGAGADPSPLAPPVGSPSRTQAFLSAVIPHTSPFTGLALSVMEPQLCDYFGAPKGTGLLVHNVAGNSPGAAAGVHAGDILLRADNVPLKTMNDWARHMHLMRGKPVALVVLRDKHEQTLTITPSLKHKSALTMPELWLADISLFA